MDINWHSGIRIDPVTHAPDPSGIEVPTYGNYGGPSYTNYGTAPIDDLDMLFMFHDGSSGDAPSDHALLRGMVALHDYQLDAEGNLYAGMAELGLISELAREGVWLSPFELAYDVADAFHHIEVGLRGLEPAETAMFGNWLAASAGTLII